MKKNKILNIEEFLSNFFKIDKKKLNNINYNKSEFWDSLKHMNLISEIENNYNLKLNYKDIIQMTNLKNIKKIIQKLKK
jgi:acyl carrier protein